MDSAITKRLLGDLEAKGLTLVLNESGNLTASPFSLITDAIKAQIIANKPALIDLLAQLAEPKAFMWLVRLPAGEKVELTVAPPASRTDVMSWYPTATNAIVNQSCQQCANYSNQFGYCGSNDRPDLPSAYTEGHPLKRLPADRGASCEEFSRQT